MPRAPLIWFTEEGSVSVNGELLSTRVKNIEVRGGTRSAEQIRTFGRGGFLAERPQENYETSITAIVSGLELAQHVFGLGSTTVAGRIVSGDGVRTAINVVYSWRDPTDTAGPSLRFRFASGFATAVEMSQAPNQQLEQTFTFTTLPSNTFWEYGSGAITNFVTPAV